MSASCIRLSVLLLVTLKLLSQCPADEATAVENAEAWIRGEHERIEMCVRGTVLLSSGAPANKAIVTATFESPAAENLPVQIDGNRFSVWVPVGRADWYSLRIGAKSSDSLERFGISLTPIDLRQVAIDGLRIELQRAIRTVSFNVVHDGKPVANANVRVGVSDGPGIKGKSSRDGVFRVDLLAREKLNSITVWTEDHRMGGFRFSDRPARDPKANSHTVELASCRDQVFRVVDGEGNPVSDLVIDLQIATPAPNYNYLGTIDASRMKTNENGEASFAWFPDWQEVHCYLELQGDWVKDGKQKFVDGVFVVKAKPKKPRHTMNGIIKRPGSKVSSKAGFHIQVRSFQGEEEGHSDFVHTVSNPDGSFTANVLADATYCICVNDTEYVSDMVDLIPWPSDKELKPTAELTLQRGVPVSVTLTAGKNNNPIANQTLHLRQEHSYTYVEDGTEQNGGASRGNWVTTNDDGVAIFKAEPGKKQTVSIYNPDWRASDSIEVVQGAANAIEIHREFDKPRVVLGMIIFPAEKGDDPMDASNLTVTVGALDGNTRHTETVKVRPDGVFSCETMATQVGVLVTTKDGKYSGVLIEKRRQRLLRVMLSPTKDLRGRLIDKDGKPIAGRKIVCNTRVDRGAKRKPGDQFASFFEANRRTTKTDADGLYVFENMPCNVKLALVAESRTKVQDHWLGLVTLDPNEEIGPKEDTLNE